MYFHVRYLRLLQLLSTKDKQKEWMGLMWCIFMGEGVVCVKGVVRTYNISMAVRCCMWTDVRFIMWMGKGFVCEWL